MPKSIERVSINLSNYCIKECPFCYNKSSKAGATFWRANEVVDLIKDCVANGTKAVSFGGGELLEYPELFEILKSLIRLFTLR